VRFVRVAHRHQDAEFVPGGPRADVACPDRRGDALAGGAEQQVAAVVAEIGVVALEVVEVGDHDDEAGGLRIAALDDRVDRGRE